MSDREPGASIPPAGGMNAAPVPGAGGSVDEVPGTEVSEPAEIDRLIHEPSRLLIMTCLAVVECADFLFVQRQTGLTGGNLSSHMTKLEEAGYLQIEKMFEGRKPKTMLSLTDEGRRAFESYRARMREMLNGAVR